MLSTEHRARKTQKDKNEKKNKVLPHFSQVQMFGKLELDVLLPNRASIEKCLYYLVFVCYHLLSFCHSVYHGFQFKKKFKVNFLSSKNRHYYEWNCQKKVVSESNRFWMGYKIIFITIPYTSLHISLSSELPPRSSRFSFGSNNFQGRKTYM